MPISYPRACPTCGTLINDRSNFSRHRKHCGKHVERAQCRYCSKSYVRKDDLKKHVKQKHAEAAMVTHVDPSTPETYTHSRAEPSPAPSLSAYDSEIEAILNRDNSGLEDPDLFNVCYDMAIDDQEGVEDLMPVEEEEWLLPEARRSEQRGGNPLFSILREHLGPTRRWQNGTVQQERLRLRLQQNRQPQEDHLGEAIAQAFFENVRQYVEQQQLTPEHYKLRMTIHHNGTGDNSWTSSPMLPLTDWIENRERTSQWLQQLANELNSSQSMDVTQDDFFAELTFVRIPSNGGRFKKWNIQSMSFQDMCEEKTKHHYHPQSG